MINWKPLTYFFFLGTLIFGQTISQRARIVSTYNQDEVERLFLNLTIKDEARKHRVKKFLSTNPNFKSFSSGESYYLDDVLQDGTPLFLIPDSNIEGLFNNESASISIKANSMYNGGSLGLDVSGQGMEVGVWEAFEMGNAIAYTNHLDLLNKIDVFEGSGPDGSTPSSSSFHATHVVGTIISSGDNFVSTLGRGIAFDARAFSADISGDEIEMLNQANDGLLVSNHSYGFSPFGQPEWFFGAYTSFASDVDAICAAAEYYLPVYSAGNDRSSFNSYQPSKGGYDTLTGNKVAKNNLVVGAVKAVLNYTGPNSVEMTNFSRWGPADDGRIKPDVVSMGEGVQSTSNASPTAYNFANGTSMAAPGISGLVVLLQQHFNNVNSSFMKAASVKGLIMHTAEEAGSFQGPDYRFGWGLPNGEEAALLIMNNGTTSYISENELVDGDIYAEEITAFGSEPLKVSISWTDPAGPTVNNVVDDRTPVLVNDLDIKLESMGTDYFPWKLDAVNYTAPATRNSTNDVDNFEKIEVDSPSANQLFNLTINHKESLQGGNQNYTLIISGGVPSSLLSVSEFDNGSKEVVITPNPAQGFVNILLKNGADSLKKVRVFDNSGKMLLLSNSNNVDIRRIPPGVYFVEIETQNKVYKEKFVKN